MAQRRRRTSDERTIIDMHTYMRPAGSLTETEFAERFLMPLGFERDRGQNLVLRIGDSPSILWSSHMDTVHIREGRQKVHFDGTMLALTRDAKKGASNCLGADCTAGVWLMTEMVKAGVEGLYVIHHAEEEGCVGSSWLAKDPAFFAGINAAIAFDRFGYESIITHQAGGKGASDEFAKSLAGILGGRFGIDRRGVYTDTNEYRELVPECTNISVGYFDQHTRWEHLDVRFLIGLRDTLVAADWGRLVIARDPNEQDYDNFTGRSKWRSFSPPAASDRRYPGDDLEGMIKQYPDIAANILQAFGVSREDFMDQVADYYGGVFEEEPEEEEEEDYWDPHCASAANTRRAA
ncbi:hypothetical protein [Aquibium microcysteis]|uniref:hypothetical protein n=1 Tax=Aquibium microcysteis TaxID=675281 RepID=UPI00165CF3A1|nr:hypothetical protein [Aquibium microcysteis]